MACHRKNNNQRPDTRKRLVAALEKGVEENKGDVMKCFNPRHGIRVTHEGMTADFVICFECFQVMVYVAGGKGQRFLITDSPAPIFNQTLQHARFHWPGSRRRRNNRHPVNFRPLAFKLIRFVARSARLLASGANSRIIPTLLHGLSLRKPTIRRTDGYM